MLASEHVYYTDVNFRHWGVAQLCQQAYWLASDAALIRYRTNMKAEIEVEKKWISDGGDLRIHQFPENPYMSHIQERRVLDYYKIGGALELALKAKLLESGHIIHEIDKNSPELRARQKKEPIPIEDFIAKHKIIDSCSDPHLPHLSKKSLSFDQLLNTEGYRAVLCLSANEIMFCDEARLRRNLMHLPLTERIDSYPFSQSLGENYINFLRDLLNKIIVDLFMVRKGSRPPPNPL